MGRADIQPGESQNLLTHSNPAMQISGFRLVAWPRRSVLLALIPLMVWCGCAHAATHRGFRLSWWPSMAAMYLTAAWMFVLPLWIARRQQAHVIRMPGIRHVVIECFMAVPTLL